jgi:hypothetical protein
LFSLILSSKIRSTNPPKKTKNPEAISPNMTPNKNGNVIELIIDGLISM